jgi:hypothetical protein
MTRTFWLRAGGAALLGILLAIGPAPKAAEDKADPDFTKLTEQTGKLIQAALKDNPDDKAQQKARTAAVVLAALAQSNANIGDKQRRATVRAAALQVADAIRNGNLDDARKQAAALAQLPADPGAKPAEVPLLGKQVTFREAMELFDLEGAGGTGGEKKLRELCQKDTYRRKKALPEKEMNDDLLVLAYRSAALAELSAVHNDATVKKDPKKWKQYAEEARQASLELAVAVREQKGGPAWTALNRLNSACSGCHSDFGR